MAVALQLLDVDKPTITKNIAIKAITATLALTSFERLILRQNVSKPRDRRY